MRITNTQIKRGVSIAQHEGDLRWEWADLALEVAPPSESHANNDQAALLDQLREQIIAHGHVAMRDLPAVDLLRKYRDAAAAVPPEARSGIAVYAARLLGTYESDKAKRLAVIEQLRTEHPRGQVTVEAVQAYFGKAPNNAPGRRNARVENDLDRSSHQERVRHAQRLMNDPAVEHEVRERPARTKNWNGKTNPTREREIKAQNGKTGNYNELLRLSLQMNRVCTVIEAYKPEEFELDTETLVLIDSFYDDLVTLGVWVDRATMATQGWLDEVKVRGVIAALRDTTGRQPKEIPAYLARADKLERQLELRLGA